MRLSPGFFTLLKVMLLLSVLAGNVAMFVTSVLPYWNSYQAIAVELEAVQTAIIERDALIDQSVSDDLIVAEAQAQNAAVERAQAAAMFLTQEQADSLLDAMYEIAARTSTTITNVQAQQPAQSPDITLYEVSTLAVRVEGPFRYLLYFVSLFRQAAAPSVAIRDLNIQGEEADAALTMTLYIYQSEFATGQAFDPIAYTPPTLEPTPTLLLPTWTSIPTATITPTTTATFTPTLTPTLTATSSATYTVTLEPTATDTPTLAPTETALTSAPNVALPTVAICEGAPPIRLTAGITAIVDFNNPGALRVMSWITEGAADTLVQAYDNDQVQILAGPECGQWQGQPVWYWYVDFQGIRGWAAEGTFAERWLCPTESPECS